MRHPKNAEKNLVMKKRNGASEDAPSNLLNCRIPFSVLRPTTHLEGSCRTLSWVLGGEPQ